MSVIVTDTGFGSEDWSHEFHSVEALGQEVGAPAFALDLASDTDPAALEGRLDGVDLIRVDFPSSADGRGFTIARALRRIRRAEPARSCSARQPSTENRSRTFEAQVIAASISPFSASGTGWARSRPIVSACARSHAGSGSSGLPVSASRN